MKRILIILTLALTILGMNFLAVYGAWHLYLHHFAGVGNMIVQ